MGSYLPCKILTMNSSKNNNLLLTLSYFAMVFLMAATVFVLKENDFPAQKMESKRIITNENMAGNNTKEYTLEASIAKKRIIEKTSWDPQVWLQDVPFTSQAPYGNWSDIIYEEWCEEASMLMAVYWSMGHNLTSEIVNNEIKKISEFEKGIFGVFHDTSINDTAKTMEKYFSFNKYTTREDIKKADMIQSLKNGHILLVPAYGRDLHNKNYTPPGPIPHMLVIIWYDSLKKEFITNDPGTKYGKSFRYNEDTLFNAIWTYPTSKTKPIPPIHLEKRKKSMIEIYR